MASRLIYAILIVAVLMAGLLLAIGLAEPVADAGGMAHPDFPGMQLGGDGAARLEHIGALGFLFQCLLLIQIVLLSMLGVSERYYSGEFYAYMGGSLLFMLIVAWQMYSGHQAYLDSGETGYFLGFPTATAWQMYGTWLGAIPLILVYSLGFSRFIYSDEDEARFKQLLQDKAAAESTAESTPDELEQ